LKIFSFTGENNSNVLPEQITLEIDVPELRKLAEFCLKCATEIEDDDEWEHEHLCDYLGCELDQDIVVYNSRKPR